jgi:hypothetical protein
MGTGMVDGSGSWVDCSSAEIDREREIKILKGDTAV